MQIPHRKFAEFLTANPPTSSPRIRRLPHLEFPTANLPTYLYRWRISISEFAENPWRMFAQSFVLSANIIHREFGELNLCEFVANIHHVSFKWTVLYINNPTQNCLNQIWIRSGSSWTFVVLLCFTFALGWISIRQTKRRNYGIQKCKRGSFRIAIAQLHRWCNSSWPSRLQRHIF